MKFIIHFITVVWLTNPMTLLLVACRSFDIGLEAAYDEAANYVEKALTKE